MVYPGEGPNLLAPSELSYPVLPAGSRPLRRRSTRTKLTGPLPLVCSPPIFERNRATVIITHGQPDRVHSGRRRRYLVASDLSKESGFAIEWCIGTLLRDGDELIVVFVIETDSKRELMVLRIRCRADSPSVAMLSRWRRQEGETSLPEGATNECSRPLSASDFPSREDPLACSCALPSHP